MVLGGAWLYFALVLLALWCAFLWRLFWKLLKVPRPEAGPYETTRSQLTVAGLGLAAAAVGALFLLHLTWLSAEISQRLGSSAATILSLMLLFPSVLAFLFSCLGSGKIRFIGVGSSFLTGFVWLGLYVSAAISGSAPIARHPTRYLIPEGYIGWVTVVYGDATAPALPLNKETRLCRIPEGGRLVTSSALEEGWANNDEYFYYSEDGSVRSLRSTGWGLGGMIWGERNSASEQYFYIGTEDQFRRGAGHQLKPVLLASPRP